MSSCEGLFAQSEIVLEREGNRLRIRGTTQNIDSYKTIGFGSLKLSVTATENTEIIKSATRSVSGVIGKLQKEGNTCRLLIIPDLTTRTGAST